MLSASSMLRRYLTEQNCRVCMYSFLFRVLLYCCCMESVSVLKSQSLALHIVTLHNYIHCIFRLELPFSLSLVWYHRGCTAAQKHTAAVETVFVQQSLWTVIFVDDHYSFENAIWFLYQHIKDLYFKLLNEVGG